MDNDIFIADNVKEFVKKELVNKLLNGQYRITSFSSEQYSSHSHEDGWAWFEVTIDINVKSDFFMENIIIPFKIKLRAVERMKAFNYARDELISITRHVNGCKNILSNTYEILANNWLDSEYIANFIVSEIDDKVKTCKIELPNIDDKNFIDFRITSKEVSNSIFNRVVEFPVYLIHPFFKEYSYHTYIKIFFQSDESKHYALKREARILYAEGLSNKISIEFPYEDMRSKIIREIVDEFY